MSIDFNRRHILKSGLAGLVLGSSGLTLAACQGGKSVSKADTVFDMWRHLREALRGSPDHPIGRAKALVEAGNVDAVFKFVRDEIRTVPGSANMYTLGPARKWGTRVTLRSGAGTVREKADLLLDLLTQMGVKAEIVDKPGLASKSQGPLFNRNYEQPFAPAVSEKQIAIWREQFGGPDENKRIVDIEDGEARLNALSRQIRGALTEKQLKTIANSKLNTRSSGYVPVVKITESDIVTENNEDGVGDQSASVRYADVLRPDSELGPYPHSDKEYTPKAGAETLPITVSILGSTTDALGETFEITKSEWSADQLAGRQLRIGFKPAVETLSLLASEIGTQRAFTPVMAVQALDGENLPNEVRFAMGDSISLEGDKITVTDDGTVSVNGEVVASGSEPSGLAGRVASVEMEVNGSLFPDIRATVTPRDSNGDIIEGLTAADFNLTDQSVPVSKLIHKSNNAPNILFLADSSLSMPREYRSTDGKMAELADNVRELAKSIHPKAKVEFKLTNSNLWEHLIKAARTNYHLVVYATDGHQNGRKPTEAEYETLSSGPRALVLNVYAGMEKARAYDKGRDTTNIFDAMALATHGEAMDVPTSENEDDQNGDPDNGPDTKIRRAIERLLGEIERPAYRLSYRAPTSDRGARTAALTLGQAQTEADYTVSDTTARGKKLASLQLRVQIGKKAVTRTLAGYSGVSKGEVSEADLNHLHGAMFGLHMLAFEGGAPSLSVIMDDILTAKLGIEDLDRAINKTGDDVNAMIDTLEAGFPVFPGELATLLARTGPLADETYACSETGLRTVLYSSHAVMNTDQFIKRVDILPLSKTYVLAEDINTRQEVAFDLSLPLNLGEAALFETNTIDLLEGRDLITVGRRPFRSLEPPMEPEKLTKWYQLREDLRSTFSHPGAVFLGPKNGEVIALWAVDNATGEIYGILPDGSGGGSQAAAMEAQLKELDKCITALNLLATAAGAAGAVSGIGGFSLAVVAAYGQRLARLYGAVSMSIILMEDSAIAPAIRAMIAEMACEIAKSMFLGVFAAAGKVAGNAVNIFAATEGGLGLAGANLPTSCPIRGVDGK